MVAPVEKSAGSDRPHRHNARSPARNLLATLDTEALGLPRANGWLSYGFFALVRHDRLRPRTPRDENERRAFCFSREWFHEKLAEREQRIASKMPRVLGGLRSAQRRQLAALLFDSTNALGVDQEDRHDNRVRVDLDRQTRRRSPKRSLQKTLKALETVCREYKELDPILRHPYLRWAEECLERVPGEPLLPALTASYRLQFEPKTFFTVLLFWFFHHECRLSENESELRAGQFRNAFWEGVAPVLLSPKSRDGKSKGCSAVHVAVRRFRL